MSPSRQTADRLLFEELVHETRDDLLAYAMRRAASPEDAADVLSETYLIAWRKLEQVPPGDSARLWLFGVAANVPRGACPRSARAWSACSGSGLIRNGPGST
jgi:RNA polymerase sigma-70 factor (ECF subfamily)